jgi:hypothetical protein
VEFTYPDASAGPFSDPGSNSSATRRAPTSISENVETVRSRLSAGGAEASNSSSTPNRDDPVGATNPDAIFGELQGLRKKYDAVVEYTVHLTAERDAIVSQLESSQRELTKEKSRKKGDAVAAAGSGKNDKGADKKVDKVCVKDKMVA